MKYQKDQKTRFVKESEKEEAPGRNNKNTSSNPKISNKHVTGQPNEIIYLEAKDHVRMSTIPILDPFTANQQNRKVIQINKENMRSGSPQQLMSKRLNLSNSNEAFNDTLNKDAKENSEGLIMMNPRLSKLTENYQLQNINYMNNMNNSSMMQYNSEYYKQQQGNNLNTPNFSVNNNYGNIPNYQQRTHFQPQPKYQEGFSVNNMQGMQGQGMGNSINNNNNFIGRDTNNYESNSNNNYIDENKFGYKVNTVKVERTSNMNESGVEQQITDKNLYQVSQEDAPPQNNQNNNNEAKKQKIKEVKYNLGEQNQRVIGGQQQKYNNNNNNNIVYMDPNDYSRTNQIPVSIPVPMMDPYTNQNQNRKIIQFSKDNYKSGSPKDQYHKKLNFSSSNDAIYETQNKDNNNNNNYYQYQNPGMVYMQNQQPYAEYSYSQKSNIENQKPNIVSSNNSGSFGGNNYSNYPQPQPFNYQQQGRFQEGGFYENPQGMMSNNNHINSFIVRDPSYDIQKNYSDSNVNENMNNFVGNNYKEKTTKSEKSPNKIETADEQQISDQNIIPIQQEELQTPEIRRAKMKEIRFLRDYTEKEKSQMEQGLRMFTEDSVKEEGRIDDIYKTYGAQIEKLAKDRNFHNTRKVSNLFPLKPEGKLLPEEVTTMVCDHNWDENLQNREKVIRRFHKLSSIINSKSFSKKKAEKTEEEEDLDQIKANLKNAKSDKKGAILSINSKHLKFIRVTLAMLSSTGYNCEDRTITRDMRFEKGGVVDLAHNKDLNDKYKIRRVIGLRSPCRERQRYSQKDRDKATKIVQAWWRNILGKYKSLMTKIVKLQACWRSFWFRHNMIDIIYATQMINTFVRKVQFICDKNQKTEAIEILKDDYAVKFSARLYIARILKLQAYARRWLRLLKDKRTRIGNLLDKLFFRRKEEVFKTLKQHAIDNDVRKKKRLESLCQNTKRLTRIAIFHDFMFSVFRKPIKELKGKLRSKTIKNNLVNNHTKYLRDYFLKWKDNAVSLKTEEFINKLNATLCLKTARALRLNKLRRKFRYWRDWTRSINDIKLYSRGLTHLSNHAKEVVAENCLEPLRAATKGMQKRVVKNLILNNNFHHLPLRHYFQKWRAFMLRKRELDYSASILVGLKKHGISKLYLKILLKRFLDWRRKANLLKVHQQWNDDDSTEKKYFALVKLMNGTEKLAKRKALNTTLPQIFAWLVDLIRQRATKDLLFMFPKLNRIALRNYFRKWTKQNDKLRQKEIRNGFFSNLSSKTGTKLRSKVLRRYFQQWHRNLPKNMQIKYYQGSEVMRNALNRSHLAKPVIAFKQKILFQNAKNGIQHAFGLKDKFIKRHWREYLIKWWKITDKIKAKESEQYLCSKLFFGFSDSYKRRILSKWWSHWKKTPKINLNDVYKRFKLETDFVRKVVFKALEPHKEVFFSNIQNINSKPFLRKVLEKLMSMAVSLNDKKLRHYLWFWQVQRKNMEINDLKLKLLKANLTISALLLRRLQNSRESEFFSRLKRFLNKDHRPMLMSNIRKRLLQPRIKLDHAFLIWKKYKDDQCAMEKDRDKMVRLLRSGTNKFNDRLKRDNMKRCLHLWSSNAKFKHDYYQKIAEGRKLVDGYLKSKCLPKPYNRILDSRNWKKILRGCLPVSSRLAQKDIFNNKLRLWTRWKDFVHNQRLQEHKALIVGKLSDKHLAVRDMNSKGKYFRYWAGIKPKKLFLPDMVKGVNQIEDVLRRPFRKPILDSLQNNSQKTVKSRVLRAGHKRTKTKSDLRLKAYLWTWRFKTRKVIEKDIKLLLLKQLGSKVDKFTSDYWSFKLHEKFLKWRIYANPSGVMKNMRLIMDGTRNLQEGCCRIFHDDVVDKLKQEAKKDFIKEALMKMLSDYDGKAKTEYLRIKFKWWRIRVKDTPIMKEKLRETVDKYTASPKGHEKLFSKHKNDLFDAMSTWSALKTNKAKTIQDYCKSLLQILQKMKNMKRNLLMHKKFTKLSKDYLDKIKAKFLLWKAIALNSKYNDSANTIQNFMRSRLADLDKKQKAMDNAGDHMLRFLKLWAFNTIWKTSKLNHRRNLLVKLLPDIPKELQKEYQRKSLLRWWGTVKKEREIEAADKINNKTRAFRSNKKKKQLIKQRDEINKMLRKLYLKHCDKKSAAFELWRSNTRRLIQNESSNVIQDFLKPCYRKFVKDKNQDMVKDLVKKYFAVRVAKAIKDAAGIPKNREQTLVDTLDDIFKRDPIRKILAGSKWIKNISKLRKLYPKIHQALSNYFVPMKFRVWYNNSVGAKMEEMRKLQEWNKDNDKAKFRSGLRKKNAFFEKHFQRLDKALDTRKVLTVKRWVKNAKLIYFSHMAEKIQANRKRFVMRRKYLKYVNATKLRSLFKVLFIRKTICELKDGSSLACTLKNNIRNTFGSSMEKRYSINNCVLLANNDYRNAILDKLTGKKCFKSNILSLRFWFNRWKANTDRLNDLTKKIQNNFRNKKARDKARLIRKVNGILTKKLLHYNINDKDKLKITFRLWSANSTQMKVNDDAKKIKDFCRVNLNKKRTQDFQRMITEWAKKLAKKRFNGAMKLFRLKLMLQKIKLRKPFIPRLINKTKADKLRLLFIKKFADLDDDLRSLYKQHFLRLWHKNAEKLKQIEKDSAVSIQTNFRSSVSRKKANIMKRINLMFMKLITKQAIRKQTAFRLWLRFKQNAIQNESSNVIQKFTRDGQKNLRSKKKKTREECLANFIKVTMNNVDRAQERPVYSKLKSQANRKLFGRVLDDLENKRTSNLKTSLDKIKEYGDMKYECFRQNAKRIQHAWNNLKWKRHIWDLIKKIKKMRLMLRLMLDRNLRFKFKAMKIWKKNMVIPELLAKAKLIKHFIKEKIYLPMLEKIPKAKKTLQCLLRKSLLKTHISPVLKKSGFYHRLYKFRLPLAKYIYKRTSYMIEHKERIRILSKLLSLSPSLRDKLLRMRLRLWSAQARKLKEDQAAKKLQSNLRAHNNRKRSNKVAEFLKKQINWLFLRHDNLKKYYFLWWSAQVLKQKQNEDAMKIQAFTRKEWERIKVKNNYVKLADGLWKRWKILNGLDILDKYKQKKRLTPVFKTLDLTLKRTGFDNLRSKGRLRRIGNLLKSMFENFTNRKDVLSLYHWFRKWRQTKSKLKQRDLQLGKMVKAINVRDHIDRTRVVKNACIVKRLGNLLDTVRAKDAFKNLKWKANNKKIIMDFGKNLIQGKEEQIKKNYTVVKDKLLKLYFYKVLCNQINLINRTVDSKLKPYFSKHFMNQFTAKYLASTKDVSKNKRKALRSGNPTSLKFKGETIDSKKKAKDNDYDTTQHRIPAGIKLLNRLVNKRLAKGFNKVKLHAKNKKFTALMQKHVNKTAPIQESFNHLVNGMKFIASIPVNQSKVRKLLRKSFIRKLKNYSVDPAKMVKQRYLLKLAFMHKNCNDKRTFREIIRKWRFHIMMMRFLKKKSENIYKQMHVNYLNIIGSLMGNTAADGFGNGSLFQEVDLLNTNMGLYKNIDPNKMHENNIEETKFSKIHKFYKFFGIDYKSKENDLQDEHEEVESENQDMYSEGKFKSNNLTGRYKEDTIK